jgi:hypothetical protein
MFGLTREETPRSRSLEKKYDAKLRVVFDAIRELMIPPVPPTNPIGFAR